MQTLQSLKLQRLRKHVLNWFQGTCCAQWSVDREAIQLAEFTRNIETSLADLTLMTRLNAGPSALLPERMRLLGLTLASVDAHQNDKLSALQATCSTCSSWRRCARDLARGDATFGMEFYCSNSAALAELRRIKQAPLH